MTDKKDKTTEAVEPIVKFPEMVYKGQGKNETNEIANDAADLKRLQGLGWHLHTERK